MDRAGAQHDALGAHVDPIAPDADPDAGRPAGLDDHAVDGGIADDPQVRTPARGLQVAVVGRDAGAVPRVEAERRDARGRGRVVVLAPRIAESEGGVGERVVGRSPRLAR